MNDLYVLDFESLAWREEILPGPQPVPRANHRASLISGSRILIFGGYTESRFLNDVYYTGELKGGSPCGAHPI